MVNFDRLIEDNHCPKMTLARSNNGNPASVLDWSFFRWQINAASQEVKHFQEIIRDIINLNFLTLSMQEGMAQGDLLWLCIGSLITQQTQPYWLDSTDQIRISNISKIYNFTSIYNRCGFWCYEGPVCSSLSNQCINMIICVWYLTFFFQNLKITCVCMCSHQR